MKELMQGLNAIISIFSVVLLIISLYIIINLGYEGEVVSKTMYHGTLFFLSLGVYTGLNCYAIRKKEDS